MNRIIAILCLILMCGCTTGRRIDLEPKYEPLLAVLEGTDKLLAPGMTTTVGHYCYVPDIKQWAIDFPVDSDAREGLLLHEQVHAKRQLAHPGTIAGWLTSYVLDSKFRWEEEKLGYEVMIIYYTKHFIYVDSDRLALSMSTKYSIAGVQMVSFDEAKAWILEAIQKAYQ